MIDTVKLYDVSNIETLPWPETEDGHYAKAYLTPLVKKGTEYFIDNVRTTIKVLTIDDLVLPVTINDSEYDNSYVCSPYTHYCTYALEEVHLIKSKIIRGTVRIAFNLLGGIFKIFRLNKVVYVNNWLLSTNLYPKLEKTQIQAITQFLIKHYPDHAVAFRSINDYPQKPLPHIFKELSYQLLLSRQVYIQNTLSEKPFRSKPFKQDHNLLRCSPYRILEHQELSPSMSEKIVELYNDLYINKYSKLNPQLNKHFIELAIKSKILTIHALKGPNNSLDAVLGYFTRQGMMTTPLLGYNTSLPAETGLYRMLAIILTLEAKKEKQILNRSSGAASFKRLRKAEPFLEYSAVYNKHLGIFRRFPWKVLNGFLQTFIVPLMKYYQL